MVRIKMQVVASAIAVVGNGLALSVLYVCTYYISVYVDSPIPTDGQHNPLYDGGRGSDCVRGRDRKHNIPDKEILNFTPV